MSDPIAWLIVERKGSAVRVLPGYVFKGEATAKDAATRLTSRWRACEALPVVAAQGAPHE